MHEWALAEAVVQTIIETARRENLKKVTSIRISLGELQGIEREIFDAAIFELMKLHNALFKDINVEIDIIKTKFECRACKNEWELKELESSLDDDTKESIHFIPEISHSFIRCPSCKSPDFEIVRGRGVSITSITGER